MREKTEGIKRERGKRDRKTESSMREGERVNLIIKGRVRERRRWEKE